MNKNRKNIIYQLAVYYVLDTLTNKEEKVIPTLKDEELKLFKQIVKNLSAPMA